MTDPTMIRRNDDGSIDFSFYRTNARALRAQAMRESSLPKVSAGALAAIACVLGLTMLFAPGPAQDSGSVVASAPTRAIR